MFNRKNNIKIEMNEGNMVITNKNVKKALPHMPNSVRLFHLIDHQIYPEKEMLKPHVQHDYTSIDQWFYTDSLRNSSVHLRRFELEIRENGNHSFKAFCNVSSLVSNSVEVIFAVLPEHIISVAKELANSVLKENLIK